MINMMLTTEPVKRSYSEEDEKKGSHGGARCSAHALRAGTGKRGKKRQKRPSHDRFSFGQGLPFGNLWKRPFSTGNIEEQREQSRPHGCV